DELGPGLYSDDELRTQVRPGEAGPDHLREGGDVTALDVLPEEVGDPADEVDRVAELGGLRAVALQPLRAGPVRGRQQESVAPAEVVEDQSRVEPGPARDGPGAGAGIARFDQRAEGGFDQAGPGARPLLRTSPRRFLGQPVKFIEYHC